MSMGVLILISLMVILVAVLVFLLWLAKFQKNLKKKGPVRHSTRKTGFQLVSTTFYLRQYKRLDHHFISRQSVRKLNGKLMELGIFDHITARMHAVKIFYMSVAMMTAMTLFGLIAFGDIFMMVVFLIAGVVAKDTILKKTLDKYYIKMLNQLSDAVSEVRQAFMRTGSVVDSLQEVVVGPLLIRQFSQIQEILGSEDAEKKLEEFYSQAPIKVLQTFAGICYAIENGGDSILANGQSNFTNSLSYIAEEIRMEIRKLKLQKDQFGSLEMLPLIPLVILAPLSWFLGNTIPGTALLYNGTYGYVVRFVVVMTSLASYLLISKINSAVAVEFDDRPPRLQKLLIEKKWRHFAKMLLPRNTKTLLKKINIIRGSLSRLTIELMYMRKVICAAIAFVASFLICISTIYLGLAFEIENIAKASLTPTKPYSVEEEETLRQLDRYYLRTTTMSEADLITEMQSSFPKMKEEKRAEEVERMIEKRNKVQNMGFKFWHLWMCLGIGFIGWNIPEMQLLFRRWLIKSESEEDVLQLQTIISILMNTSMDTLELLDWLAKHSRVHQHILIECFHEYASDADLALNKLKQRAALPEFKRMIDKLLITVQQVTIAEAFSDLAQERHHLNSMREMAQTDQVRKKRQRMSPIAMLSMVEVVGLYFIGPVAIVGVAEFTKIMANLPI